MQPATPNPYRWTRERWYKAGHLERLYARLPYHWHGREPRAVARLEQLREAHPGMTGQDPLDTPLWQRRARRFGWGDEVPF